MSNKQTGKASPHPNTLSWDQAIFGSGMQPLVLFPEILV
jgi:hypothetical protein